MLKKSLLTLLCLANFSVFAQELTSFTEVTQALSEGHDLSVVVKDNLCTMTDPNTPQIPKSTMVHRLSSVIFTEELLSFDAEKFTFARPPYYNDNLMQRAVFVLNNKEEISIRIGFFSAETHKKLDVLKDVMIDCQLGQGAKFYKK